MSKRKKKRLKVFYPIYFSLVILAIAAICVLCGRLKPFLADYELSNPKYAAEEGARYFENADAETFYRFALEAHPELFQYEDKQSYIDWISALTQGGSFEYKLAYSPDPSIQKYNVKLNGEKFGSYSLREIPNSTEYGFSTWAFDSLETIMPEGRMYTVTAFSNAVVYAGDQRLGEADAVETGIPTAWTGHMLVEETPSPSQTRYAFTRYFGCPEISVTDASGQACALIGDEETGFTALRNDDSALKAETEARVTEIVKKFSAFTSSDISTSDMLQYVRKGTNAYPIIQNFDNNWFGRHSSAKVENLNSENYIRFTGDTMACDVTYDYVVQYTDGEKTYPTAYRFYLVLRNDQWFLYDFMAL